MNTTEWIILLQRPKYLVLFTREFGIIIKGFASLKQIVPVNYLLASLGMDVVSR